jgi:hypothetical protein
MINNEYLKKLRFYKTPLEQAILNSKAEENEDFARILLNKTIMNNAIEEEIRSKIRGEIENFLVILIHGSQGSIKSSVMIQLCKKIDPNFTAQQISFLLEEMKTKINDSQPLQAYALDEQVYQHGTGIMRLTHEIQNMIETLRIRQNSIIVVCVTPKYFDESIFSFVLETLDKCMLGTCEKNPLKHEIRNCPLTEGKKHDIKEVWVRLAVKKEGKYLGLYYQEVEWNNSIWNDYCPFKDSFAKKSLNQDFTRLDFEKKAEEIMQDPEISLYKNLKSLKLLIEKRIPNLTSEEKELIAQQIKINREKKKNNSFPPSEDGGIQL